MSRIDTEILKTIVAIFTDGGVIKKNPSAIGGTWAFVCVDAQNEKIYEESGVVPAPNGKSITNNQTEIIAIIKALEAMPENWNGILFSDSKISLGRVFEGWKMEGLTTNIIARAIAAKNRAGKDVKPILLQGHPTKKMLVFKSRHADFNRKINQPLRRCRKVSRRHRQEKKSSGFAP